MKNTHNLYASVRRNITLPVELDEWVLQELARRSRKTRRNVKRSELVKEALLLLRDHPALRDLRG